MARLLVPGESARDVTPAGESFTLAELYALIGCQTVELVALPDAAPYTEMWVDEDGKTSQPEANVQATRVLRRAGGLIHDVVMGPALLCAPGEVA